MNIVRKVHAERRDGNTFVLSDETVDRVGDIILADGWQLDDFRKNPIALFGHRGDLPIGTWKNLRIEKKTLLGEFEPAPKGVSERADEINGLIEVGVLKATSVGFQPIERKVRRDKDNEYLGLTFTKQVLVETSMVAVPANPNALAVAKELKLSDDARKLVFAEIGKKETKPVEQDHMDKLVQLTEPEKWSPEQARQAKLLAQGLLKERPNYSLYRKMLRLFEELECVCTIRAEFGKRRK